MYKAMFMLVGITIMATGCIKDDFIDDAVEPVIRISNPADNLEVGGTYDFMANYFNNVGVIVDSELEWTSSNSSVISIDSETGISEAVSLGTATISVKLAGTASGPVDMHEVNVVEDVVDPNPVALSGTIATTSTYLLTGSFTFTETETGSLLEFSDNYVASTALPGLYIYLTNNPNTTAGAHEIGPVSVFSGAHSYALSGVSVFDYSHVLYYCAPFNIKVGDGQIN